MPVLYRRRARVALPLKLRNALACVPLALLLHASESLAVRPFVTDDARIVDRGQIETENWLETNRADGSWDPAPGLNTIWGASLTDWFEVLGGAGIGNDRQSGSTIANPVLIGKLLFKAAEVNGAPGLAFSASTTFDRGRGSMYDEGRVTAYTGMATYRLWDDDVNIHANLGWRYDKGPDNITRDRPYWGIGADIKTPKDKLQFVIEAFAGDPFIVNAPKYAFQTGFRWMESENLQMDLTFGFQPETDGSYRRSGGYEKSVQLGVRLLFDAFTPGGRAGNPEGARGLFH